MRLHYARTSPYVRKVMIAAHELGIADDLDLVGTTPETIVADVAGDNPLAQIPTLVLDDGAQIYDSLVICEYLNTAEKGDLFPPPGPARWAALTRHALGQGLTDNAISRVHERRRPEAERSAALDAKRKAAVARTLDMLEGTVGAPDGAFVIGDIAVAAGLGYLDLRFGEDDWRAGRPQLAGWYEAVSARPSVRKTAPEG